VNRNSLFGLLGITLLVFLVAFMAGRWSRPARAMSSSVSAVDIASPAEPSNLIDSQSDRLLTAVQAEAYEDDLDTNLASRVDAQPNRVSTRGKYSLKAQRKPLSASSASPDRQAAQTTAADIAPATKTSPGTTDTTADAVLATEMAAPKAVIAKDYIAIEERQNYASLLPTELLKNGVEVKVNVAGELSDVIILSSPSFDARSKDTVIKQVCVDLKSLGFKRVHITDGGEYSMHFGL
jgi:sRNA-binding protein